MPDAFRPTIGHQLNSKFYFLSMKQKLKEHIEKIIPITGDEFSVILSYFSFENYNKKDLLIQQGMYVNRCYFVVSGLLKLVYNDEDGKQHFLGYLQ